MPKLSCMAGWGGGGGGGGGGGLISTADNVHVLLIFREQWKKMFIRHNLKNQL